MAETAVVILFISLMEGRFFPVVWKEPYTLFGQPKFSLRNELPCQQNFYTMGEYSLKLMARWKGEENFRGFLIAILRTRLRLEMILSLQW